MRLPLQILLLCTVAIATSASAQEAEAALKQFEGKILILRHPLQSKSQQYDSDGKVLKGGDEGPWTVCGGVRIDKIALAPDKLRFEGRRIFFPHRRSHRRRRRGVTERSPKVVPPFSTASAFSTDMRQYFAVRTVAGLSPRTAPRLRI